MSLNIFDTFLNVYPVIKGKRTQTIVFAFSYKSSCAEHFATNFIKIRWKIRKLCLFGKNIMGVDISVS